MEIEALISILEDPFNMFPLEGVSSQLGALIDERDEQLYKRAGWWGVSPKYRTVEDEHDLEVIQLLIGSAFVLGQAAITQTVSIVTKLRELADCSSKLPNGKAQIMSLEANIHPSTGLSEIVLFDAVANYFKHHYEWPTNWSGATGAQLRTIDLVLKLGLMPGGEHNLHIALRNLGMNPSNMSLMGKAIQEWRERLAVLLRTICPNDMPSSSN